VNVVILCGRLSSPPRHIELRSGDDAVALELTVRHADGPADTVPVAWFSPGHHVDDWAAGEELVVVGRVRRRFFRAGAATASRTEVLASAVVPARQRAGARRAVARALAEVQEGAGVAVPS
jgi:single-strand DNA-binding protein